MGASKFIGRVGCLAVAMGVGAGWFAVGAAVADAGPDTGTAAEGRTQTTQTRAPQGNVNPHRGAAASRPVVAPAASTVTSGGTAIAVGPSAEPTLPSAPRRGPIRSTQVTEQISIPAAPKPSASVTNQAPPSSSAAVTNQVTSQAAPQTSATASGSLAVNPSVTWGGKFDGKNYPGLLVGTVGATSSNPLRYETVSQPSLGGKLGAVSDDIFSQATKFSKAGEFFYIPDQQALYNKDTTETFKIRVSEQTKFDEALASIPLVGLIAPTVISLMQQLPLVGSLLAPIIGASEVVTFKVSPYSLAYSQQSGQVLPTAFTTKVKSFDGLMVSTNYFPATNVATGAVTSAPTVVFGPGLGTPGVTNPTDPNGQLGATELGSLTPGLPVLRDGRWISPDGGPSYTASTGFNVITWDPRGSFATKDRSLPGMQIDAPFFEARDTSALISWLTSADNPARTQAAVDKGDPLIGMVGGSYGGGIPWTTAGIDPRVDAIAPEISWNSMLSALYPNNNQFKTGFGTLLAGILLYSGTDVNPEVYTGVLTGVTLGWLSQTAQAVLASAGPTVLVNKITAPALIFQGVQDILFPLKESVANAESLVGAGTETKMVWFCGGHGQCNVPLNPQQADRGFVDNLKWLDRYLVGIEDASTQVKAFQWYDQLGGYHSSNLLPFQAGFNKPAPLTVTGKGGVLGLWPILGGSGPGFVDGVSPVLSIGNASEASNAINLTVTPPADSQIVGAPTLSFSYSGLGTSRTVYAQLVDETSGLVLGNIVTPIPVVLDGRDRSVTIPLDDIAYTTPAGGKLKLQITSSATNFENFTSFGVINIGDITVKLPIHDQSA
jgi:ABC-2 type transport system ATP-binding protein